MTTDNQHPSDGIQGEMPEGKGERVPEEIMQWIETQDRDYPGSGHAIGWKKGAIAMYNKMQQESEIDYIRHGAKEMQAFLTKQNADLTSDNGILQAQLLAAKKDKERLQSDLTAMIGEAADKSEKLDEALRAMEKARVLSFNSRAAQVINDFFIQLHQPPQTKDNG